MPVVAPQPRSVQVAPTVDSVIRPVYSVWQPTLLVVAPQPRSAQVASPDNSIIQPVPSMCQPTLPVVATPFSIPVPPRSMQVDAPISNVSSPVRSFAEVVSGKPPSCQQNFNKRMHTWGVQMPTMSNQVTSSGLNSLQAASSLQQLQVTSSLQHSTAHQKVSTLNL